MVKPAELKLKEDRIQDWISRGAQMTPTVKGLLKKARTAAKA